MICFQVASNGSVEDHTVCPDPKPLVFGRRGCWGASPAASGPQGPTACCCCQTAGWGSAPHPGRLCPRSAVKRWLPGGTCSSVRCHPSATAPLPVELEEGGNMTPLEGCRGMGFPQAPTCYLGNLGEEPPLLISHQDGCCPCFLVPKAPPDGVARRAE